ncbi:ferredoxin [Alsobacter soli]|uniref:Ferredoxin n=1 Tax=Alsobacter soli TaxID=2109933 RepID=A0A2T1HV26_9HYPH|nr:4Fe-4S dicluster domain-containing protein [Alsobacter soli]PSC05522.1 ferredoxin [Alsobacter soli]
MNRQDCLERLREAAAAEGLAYRGAFAPRPTDSVPDARPGQPTGTLALFGFAGRDGFSRFAQSPEFADGLPHPLDRWSRRVVEALAADAGGKALFPFGGPPYHPFQRWAARAEDVRPSPLGLFIHPVWGLWHSYRGAVALVERIKAPQPLRAAASSCDVCAAKPCLSACPVGAYSEAGFAVDRCAAHLGTPEGRACMEGGCLARRTCPVGAHHAHDPQHAAFTMRAFKAAHPA